MWLCILLHDVDAHSLGQMLAESQEDGAAIVSQALDGKATSTLLKRARSIGKYVSWAKEKHVPAFPMTPTKLRRFLKPLVKGDRKSALRDFAGAVVFNRFVLGFKVAEDLFC